MFKIIICFFVVLNSIVFGKIVPHPSSIILSKEVTLDRGQVFNLESELIKITGLGNIDKLYYTFSNYDERLQKDGVPTGALMLENIRLVKVQGNHNEDSNYIDGVRGQTSFKISGQFRVKSDPNISGEYRMRLMLRFSDEKNSISNEGAIDILIKIKVLKVLQLATTTMDLGSAVKGQKLSTTSGGTPGYLKISGTSNSLVEVKFPATTFIYNKNNSDKLLVDIKSSPSSNGDNLELMLSNTGEYQVRFDGEVKNTSKVSPGEYKGSFKIQVRYD